VADLDQTQVSWIGASTDIDARVRAERSLRMIADASRRLGATLEDPMEIEAVVRGALSILGDLAMLDLVNAGARSQTIKLAVRGASAIVLEHPRFAVEARKVFASGRAELYCDVRAAVALAAAQSVNADESLRFLGELQVTAYMCLPLTSRGRSVGTLTLARMATSGAYDAGEVALAEDLARRIGVAIDNARLHETTERRREELERANRSKDVFLATLSHELRTPLNAIVGWTDMIRRGQVAHDELGRAIETIDRNAHALDQLVADLLDVSRIVTGSLNLDSTLVVLASVVASAVLAVRPQCVAKNVTLDATIERVGCVKGDAGRLRQVLGNLLSNAVKFTPKGGTITVQVTREGASGRVVVSDTGDGVKPELLPHVFERFRQRDDAKTRGLGLGLAIVKHLVEEHGGSVTGASDGAGKGATFTVELPIAAEEAHEDELDAARVSVPAPALPVLAGVHALVVEDDPDGNELITTILERCGARVTAVGTAAAALEALDAERPDILVSDIGLPDVDGLDLIKIVRNMPLARSMPAIALTAYASRQDAASAIAAGFDAHVAKPVQPRTLGVIIARLVAKGRPSSVRASQTVA